MLGLYSCSSTRKLDKSISQYSDFINSDKHISKCNFLADSIVSRYTAEGKKVYQIILMRHAKPDVKKSGFYTRKKAIKYQNDYNTVDIQDFDKNMIQTQIKDADINCSTLNRSYQTAKKIFGDGNRIKKDSLFREFELKIIDVGLLIPMPLIVYKGISRIGWMMGANCKGIECRKSAVLRAKKASEFLIEESNKNGTSILVAHGMLNKAIQKQLRKNNWIQIRNKTHKNLGISVLIKIE
jgi:broad specificity phosphatase PhoE